MVWLRETSYLQLLLLLLSSLVDTLKLTGEVVSSPSGSCQIDLNPINVLYLARTRLNK